MKKLLVLLALCMVLSIVMVACEEPVTPPAETTQGTTTDAPTTDAPTTEEPTTEEITTDPGTTETDTTTPPETSTEEESTTPPPPPADPVKAHLSFDECDPWTGETQGTGFFAPGQNTTWDLIANVEDYNVSAIRVWGWVAWYNETPGVYGYQIGDADPVFDDAFTVEPEQAVVEAALTMGGKSGTRMKIMIPIEYVGGEGIVIKALAKDVHGTIETLVEFTLNKPANPNAPLFVLDAADIAGATNTNEMASNTLSANGTYTTIVGANDGQHGDLWLSLISSPIQGAQYVVIKYRTSLDRDGQIFIGSAGGPSGSGDCPMVDYTSDGNWQLAVIDLAQESITSIDKDTYTIAYLRFDAFTDGKGDATIDVAYIAAFNSVEAAYAYDAQFAGVYRDVPEHEDVEVSLGDRTGANKDVPFSSAADKKIGQKLPLGETFLKQVTVKEMATYADGNTNTWSFKIWQWNTDYETTVAGTPLFVTTGENHNDNSDFVVDIPAKLLISGDVYYEIEYLTGTGGFTGWTAENVYDGVEAYSGGVKKDGSYAGKVVVGVEITEPELGSEENPVFVEFNWTDTGADATVTVPAGATVYYQGYFFGMILSINGENMGVQTSENPRMPVVFSITNDGEADAEYAIVISYPAGTMDNPEQLVIGENTAVIEAGNSQGYFFTYTAEADGTLTITVSCDAGWTYCINNLTTYVYGDIQWSDSDPVVNPAVIEVSAGDEIQIMVNTYDAADMWNIPAGTIIVTAALDSAAAAPENQTASVVIGDYAAANAWENSTLYSEILVNADITVSVVSTVSTGYASNSGKYYTKGEGWRTYQTEAPEITVTAAEGKTIVSVKVTYESNNTGVLLNGDAQVESDAVVEVNANSITFGVGNTDETVTNGQVRITAIEVIYG